MCLTFALSSTSVCAGRARRETLLLGMCSCARVAEAIPGVLPSSVEK